MSTTREASLRLNLVLGVLCAGLAVAWLLYGSGRVDWLALRERLGSIPGLFANGWYVDRAYDAVVIQPGKAAASFSAHAIDETVIDGAVNGVGGAVRRLASTGRRLQTGYVRTYALFLFAGGVAFFAHIGGFVAGAGIGVLIRGSTAGRGPQSRLPRAGVG